MAGVARFRLYGCGCDGALAWMHRVGDLAVCLPLAGCGRGLMVDPDGCLSYSDCGGVGIWAV